MPDRFVFLRHGETAWNADGRTTGRTDLSLNRAGLRQALAARPALAAAGVDAIWCSPLRRCRQTLRLAVGAPRPAPLHLHPGLVERDWGPWQGLARDLRPGFEADAPGVEPYPRLLDRVAKALAELRASGARLPLVVAHAGVHRAICTLLDLPPPPVAIANAAPHLVQTGPEARCAPLEGDKP